MPHYVYKCDECGDYFEDWASIHSEPLKTHPKCDGGVRRVILSVNTIGVGKQGIQTRDADARQKRWDRDGKAYKALRDQGMQPVQIDGCADLTAKAKDRWYIETGGKVSVPEERRTEINEMLAEGKTSSWNPVEEVKKKRKVSK